MMIDDGWGHGNSNNVLCQQLWCQKWQQQRPRSDRQHNKRLQPTPTSALPSTWLSMGNAVSVACLRGHTLHNIRLWQELLRTCT